MRGIGPRRRVSRTRRDCFSAEACVSINLLLIVATDRRKSIKCRAGQKISSRKRTRGSAPFRTASTPSIRSVQSLFWNKGRAAACRVAVAPAITTRAADPAATGDAGRRVNSSIAESRQSKPPSCCDLLWPISACSGPLAKDQEAFNRPGEKTVRLIALENRAYPCPWDQFIACGYSTIDLGNLRPGRSHALANLSSLGCRHFGLVPLEASTKPDLGPEPPEQLDYLRAGPARRAQ